MQRTTRNHPARRRPIDGKALRTACGAFATGVTVITTGAPGDSAGTTVNSFSSVSLDPPLVLFCLHRESRLAPALRRSGGFVVNFLTHRQKDLAWAFAGRDTARLEDVPHERTDEGLPVLHEALGFLVCQLVAEYEAGDHSIVVGEVVEVGAHEQHEEPLVFFRGAMRMLDDMVQREIKAEELANGLAQRATGGRSAGRDAR